MFCFYIDKQVFVIYNLFNKTNVRIIRSKIYINIYIETSDDRDPYYNEKRLMQIDN